MTSIHDEHGYKCCMDDYRNTIICHHKKNHRLINYCSYACLNVMHVVTLCYTFPLIQFLNYDFDVCCFLTKSFIRPLFQTIANWCCINHRGKSAQNFSCASAHISNPISQWRLNPGSDRRDHEGVRADRTTKERQQMPGP